MSARHEFVGKAAEENEEGEDDAVVEEDVVLRGPGHTDEEDGESGPGDKDRAAMEIGASEDHKSRGTERGQGGSGEELLVEGKILCSRGTFGETRQAQKGVVENEGDGQRGEQ